MGIKFLRKFIIKKQRGEKRCIAIKPVDLKDYSGCKIAIDANLVLKKFILNYKKRPTIKNKKQEDVAHLFELFYRTIDLIKYDIKPVYVFDGNPPMLKKNRNEQLSDKIKKKTKEAIHLLKLMGIPHHVAKEEAEAECCAMVENNIADYVATDDMDALPFGATKIIRNLTSITEEHPLEEVDSEKVMKLLLLEDRNQLIDFCILLGCSYCKTIEKIGPERAHKRILQYKNIEKIINNIDKKKFTVPNDWKSPIYIYKEAQKLFIKPEISDLSSVNFEWIEPVREELLKYLCDELLFNRNSVENGFAEIKNFISRISENTVLSSMNQ